LPKSSIFNLRATGGDAAYTQAFLEATMEEYINLKKELFAKASTATESSMQEKLTQVAADLETSKEAVISFQSANEFVLTGGNSAADNLAALQQKLAAQKSDLQNLKMLTTDQDLEGAYLEANRKLLLLKDKRDALTNSRATSDKLELARVNEDITQQEALVKIFQDQSQQKLKDHQRIVEQKIQNLEGEVREWEMKALDASKKLAEFQARKEEVRRLQGRYDQMLGGLQTLDVDKGMGQESVTILDAATPAVPVPLEKLKHLIMTGMIALFVGIGIVVFIDRLDDRPSCFADLEQLFDMPVLGHFPLMKAKNRRLGVPILQLDDDRYPLIEANRSLRSALLYQDSPQDQPKSIVITSARPSDGKSMVSANLAMTLAQTGARVLLIDADLRRGILHKHFSVASSPGLAEVLAGQCAWSAAVVQTSVPNLYMLPCGKSPRHSVNLFATAGKVLTEIAGHFDYYLFDTAPVMVGDDVLSLAPHVDGVVMVIRAGFTSGRIAQSALDSLHLRRVKVLGLVFNAVQPNASDYYYYRFKDYYRQHPAA
jgi:capsular exopolysaccharide synthesis family protein